MAGERQRRQRASKPWRCARLGRGDLRWTHAGGSVGLPAEAQSNKSEIDRKALICFKSGVSSDPDGVLSSWVDDSLNFCSWRGINLTDNGLSGTIPDELGKLPGLRTLMLAANNLEGEIPDSLGTGMSLSHGSTTQQSSNYKETMKKVSYGDILKATSWFSQVNKISSSRTGSVYIGRFEFETDLVAIKNMGWDAKSRLVVMCIVLGCFY
ncbi:hypothetical protein E2562_006541 [Oryza meyeriana var. granulata]|uniref:Leucine-rich repeat-containing N-terminal plant-type domain-containing protein n=1 Tax=Oryza meyeriana var. granulata TaxID=110450 RepID=A0A6G1BUV7_9ORYZ|nr:hypothetical protein E2562_006541 [Oryza meyeriana var. granulata]